MSVEVDVQYAVDDHGGFPSPEAIRHWAEAVLAGRQGDKEITVRIVGRSESAYLNETYRHKHGPTNVLAFALEPPAGLGLSLVGDLVICAPLVFQEARRQGKRPEAHWAHLVVHGVLHLLGYDHEQPSAAATMETLETQVLERLGFPNPYVLTEDITHERRPT